LGQIVGMRHILVHVYWGVNRDLLWKTVQDDLPPLGKAIEAALIGWPLPASAGEPPEPEHTR